ncbi:hypothetical protein Tco_1425798, partial [Tanacetum coccineum]
GEGSTNLVESHHTPTSAPSTSQPPTPSPFMQTTHAAPMPHDSPIPIVHLLGSDEGSLTLNEMTVLLKKLEKTVKTSQARRRAKTMVSDDEEDEEDSSKQGRSPIEDMDLDARISLVPPQVANQGRFDDTHVSDQPEEQLGVFSAAKVLADAARIRRGVENIHTYTRRTVSTGSGLVSTAGMARVSTAGMARVSTAAMRIQEEVDESKRQRMAQVHQAAQGFTNAEWDAILARVAADEDLVQQLQAGEKYSEEDLPRNLVELVNQRKKFFAQQRAEAKRNKPMYNNPKFSAMLYLSII